MARPLVSVLTTVYNREEYIAECIESVLASSFQDYEHIIVDDCSMDKSYEIAVAYAKKDSRLRVYRNEKNLGDYPNRNRAAELAAGEYLKYLDSDDVLYPHGLEVMVKTIIRFPEAAAALSQDGDDNVCYPVCLTPEQAYREHFFKRDLFGRSPGSAIIRAEAFRQVGGFSAQRMTGDTELWFKLAGRFPTVKMPRDLYWCRTHDANETVQGHGSDTYTRFIQVAVEALRQPACPLPADEVRRARRLLRRRLYKSAARALLWERDVRRGWEFLRAGFSVRD